jgi:hypothetical protein
MSMTIALCLAVAALQNTSRPAYDKPNFAGEWILVAPEDAASRPPRHLTVVQDAASIKVTRASDAGSESTTYPIGGDGGSAAGTSGARSKTLASARWVDRSLALNQGECRQQSLENCVERREAWSIDQKGLLTIELTTYGPGKNVSKQTFIYRRPGA